VGAPVRYAEAAKAIASPTLSEGPTTAPSEPLPTGSSASSTAASATTPSTTNTPPGATASNKPLDNYGRGMSDSSGARPFGDVVGDERAAPLSAPGGRCGLVDLGGWRLLWVLSGPAAAPVVPEPGDPPLEAGAAHDTVA